MKLGERSLHIQIGATLLACASMCAAGDRVSAQTAEGADPLRWNDERVLDLIDRARQIRRSVSVDPALRSYQAAARGYVYFYVDRADSAQQLLVKADQVALDVFWRAPNDTKQRIVGLRDEKVLPTSVRYHVDHLSVVQDDFGDFIRLGDGDEVARVAHPVGPDSESYYDFQLVDSLTLSYAAGQEEVRVYEVAVRPKDFSEPGFVGTIYLDRDRAAIVRMNFSFTPASYVDPFLDYIRISLDNSLWMGAYWLPYRQETEIRRESPVLDFQVGSIIRGRFTVGSYDFNVDLPSSLFAGRPVASASVAEREAFPFERGLFDELEEQGGLGPSPTMDEVRRQVRAVVEDEALSGLDPFRFHASRISDFLRYNRAEGLFVGVGATARLGGSTVLRQTAGYSFGRGAASGAIRVTSDANGVGPTLDAYWDALGDIGTHPGATPLENTISSVSGEKDYLDPFYRRGAQLTFRPGSAGRWSVSVRWEDHRSARDVVSDGETDFRPVLGVHEGVMGAVSTAVRPTLPGDGRASLEATGGRLGDRSFASLGGSAWWHIEEERWNGDVRVWAAATNRAAPAQTLYMLGGRMTLPGHDYRAFAGNAYWLVRLEGTVPLYPPYIGLRGFTAVGATYLDHAGLPAGWTAQDSGGPRGSVGLGLSFGWDSVRFDVGRAVWGSGWEAVVSVAPAFRTWM